MLRKKIRQNDEIRKALSDEGKIDTLKQSISALVSGLKTDPDRVGARPIFGVI